jgi:site-specific DNA-methyltransferase (adenine-specific)
MSTLPINQILAGEFTQVSSEWPSNSIDLTVTSPPYGNLRNYKGYVFNSQATIRSLYRVTKPGGVVVWVVGDQTINGGESGISFQQARQFQACSFILHDTMIYEKNTSSFPARRNGNRYTQIFEYMFVFSKDGEPKWANLICDKDNQWEGCVNWGKQTYRSKDGLLVETNKIKPVPEFSPRNNVWRYVVGGKYGQTDRIAYNHPATMPEGLAKDHISTWSKEGDVVLDPMPGSGTTCKMAKLLGRNYIGVDIAPEYCEIARQRVDNASRELYEEQRKQEQEALRATKAQREAVLMKLSPEERQSLGFPLRPA